MAKQTAFNVAPLRFFDSFGFANRAWIESNHMLEISLWNPDENASLRRSARIPDTVPGISRFQQVVLHQGRIERFFLDAIKDFSKGEIEVERGVLPTSLEIDTASVHDPDAYPITVNLRHLSEEEAQPKQASTSDNGTTIQDGLFICPFSISTSFRNHNPVFPCSDQGWFSQLCFLISGLRL